MGKLTDILIATAGLYEILKYHENQPTIIDRAVEKGVKLCHAGTEIYRIIIPEPPDEHIKSHDPKYEGHSIGSNGHTIEYYKEKIKKLSEIVRH